MTDKIVDCTELNLVNYEDYLAAKPMQLISDFFGKKLGDA